MKKLILLNIFLFATVFFSYAQKFAYVDTEYILENITEYQDAQTELDRIAAEWQAEIEKRYAAVEKLYMEYQAEQVLLTEEMKKQREEEIIAKEKAIKEYQKQKFGYEGELFKKRQELVKPIQDRVYDAIQKIAKSKGYDIILDRSAGLVMLYAEARFDKSDDVLRHLGYATGTTKSK